MRQEEIKNKGLIYYCDNQRHLICVPYSIENLHLMAQDLGIKKCWFRNKKQKGTASRKPHYDIPKKRLQEIQNKCIVVSFRDIFDITQNETTL